jgi:hypothetical protein
VITRSEDIYVPPGGRKTLDGIWVACIDNADGVPVAGTRFDVAPALEDWRGIEAAAVLQAWIADMEERERFCDVFAWPSQVGVWRITDNNPLLFGAESHVLRAGIDLKDTALDFPRMSHPGPVDTVTSVVVPRELLVPDVLVDSDGVLAVNETVLLEGVLSAPEDVVASGRMTWRLETPESSGASLSSQEGATNEFTADVRGIYRAVLEVEVGNLPGDDFLVEGGVSFVAQDENVDTFERDVLSMEGPFDWETSVVDARDDTTAGWYVTSGTSHTGSFSAATPALQTDGSATISASFVQAEAETFSFAFRVSSAQDDDFLVFTMDGVEHHRWSGEVGWTAISVSLAAGRHTAEWSYQKAAGRERGADRAWIDDVVFPRSAAAVAIDAEPDEPGEVLPAAFDLEQNYPNPFNPTTTIAFVLARTEHVALTVFDALGRRLATLAEGVRDAGHHEVEFDASGLPNGTYFYELTAGEYLERKSMVLLK